MWYVVQVLTGQEKKTIQLLKEIVSKESIKQGRILKSEKKIRTGGSFKTVEIELFPGYVFVETDAVGNLYEELKGVPELTKILGVGKEIVELTREEEDFLFGLIDNEFVIRMSEGVLVDDRVIIHRGPLKGYEGSIKSIDRRKKKAELEIEFFQKKTKMTVGLEIIKRIEKAD